MQISDRILTGRLQFRLMNITTHLSDISEKDAFNEHLHVVHERLLKGGIVIVMCNLNARVDFDNILVGHVMGRHVLGDPENDGERFVDFCNDSSLMAHWISIGQQRTPN